MHSAKVFKLLNLVKRVNIWHLRQLGVLEHDGEKVEPATPHPLNDGLRHWVRNGLLGLGPRDVQLRRHPEEDCESPPLFFLTTQVLISSPQFWTPKSSGNRKLFITHSAIKLTWCEAFHGLLNILMECEFLLQDIFCSGWGADPMSVGWSAHGHAHSIIYLKFENFAPGNQRVPRVWIRIVESVDFPSGVSTLPNFSLSRVSLGNVNRSHTFCWWYFCWQRVFEMVTRVPTAASSSSTDFLRYACRKTLCMGLQGSRVFLLVHGSLCFVIVRISLITSLMLNPFP